jgi:hypothetical protein
MSERTIVDTPAVDDGNASRAVLEVTDPMHALYGKRFRVLRIGSGLERSAQVFVHYCGDSQLRIPLSSTSLSTLPDTTPRAKLTRDSVEELLSLVKECESCPSLQKTSGQRSARRRNKKSRNR